MQKPGDVYRHSQYSSSCVCPHPEGAATLLCKATFHHDHSQARLLVLLCRQPVSTILHIEDAQRVARDPNRARRPGIIDKYSQYSSGVYAPMQREGRFPDTRPVDQHIDTRPFQPSSYAEVLELEASLPQRQLVAKVQVRAD